MKRHGETDTRGIWHSLVTTDAAQSDITQRPALRHGEETTLSGDKVTGTRTFRRGARRLDASDADPAQRPRGTAQPSGQKASAPFPAVPKTP